MSIPADRSRLVGAILFALAVPVVHAADIYYQPFDISPAPDTCNRGLYPDGAGSYPFPSDWQLFNVDGRTPDGQVGYINEAWEVREDFNFDVTECVAFSTSFYSPVGAADDWMWSPAIDVPAAGASLSWRAVAYDPNYRDGYQVRIKTGAAPTLANQASSDIVYTNPAEETAWTARSFDLSAYAGQTVYVGFRNNSNDKFVLVVDDVRVVDGTDLAAQSPVPAYATEYARMPPGMTITPTLAVTASNAGGLPLSNVSAIAQPMLDGAATGAAVSSIAPLASLAAGASAPLAFGAPAAYSGTGTWSTRYTLHADQSANDGAPENDTIEIPGTVIGGNELARWEGAATGALGIGAGNGGELGVALTIPVDGWYVGAHFAISAIPPEDSSPTPSPNLCPGFNYVVNLRVLDIGTNQPGVLIDSTEPVACEFDTDYSVDAPFVGGAHFLAAGTYVLTAVEPVNGPTLRLRLHDDRFLADTTWADWPTNPAPGWSNFEDFGTNFMKTPELSLLAGAELETPIFVDGFDGSQPVRPAFRLANKPLQPIAQRPLRKPAPTQLVRPQDR